MAAISLRAVAKQFGKTNVIRQLDLNVDDGEFTVIVGPSGCGKSTLLRLVAGLEEVSGGSIAFGNDDVTELAPAERGVAMVFQSYALYPHMTVFDNMAFGLKLAKKNRQAIMERVEAAARSLQIEHLLQRKPRELSGGQRQRVAIGRAIVRQPRVFLFDEPLSNLDAALRVQMRLELKSLHQKLGTTMVYVTHDQVEAMTLADRIVVLNNGNLEQVGSPLDLYRNPHNLFVAGFIGSPKMNFINCRIKSSSAEQVELELDKPEDGNTEDGNSAIIRIATPAGSALQVGASATLGFRPEQLLGCEVNASADTVNTLAGKISSVEHLGAEAFIHLDYNGAESLVFKASGDTDLVEGQPLVLQLPTHGGYLFDQNGIALSRSEASERENK